MEARTNRRRLAVILGGAAVVLSVGVTMVAANPDTPTNAASVSSASVYQSQVAAWANANGLTGSSPAGLSVPIRTVEQAEVAAWAEANGLTGFSPSSLRSIDD